MAMKAKNAILVKVDATQPEGWWYEEAVFTGMYG
jgi:hypothetical protein